MYYITVKKAPQTHQMSLEELFFGTYKPIVLPNNESNTHTYEVADVSDLFQSRIDVSHLIWKLKSFNEHYDFLRESPREELYNTFFLPKKGKSKKKWRRIDAPCDELMLALRTLKGIFEVDFHALYHTSAFAYIKKRCTKDAIQRHVDNESQWYAKFDLSDFFGSTTLDYVMHMFSMIFPFSEVIKEPEGKIELKKALELGFLNGGLPQGTPLSPTITNIIMIPVDFILSNTLRDYNKQHFVYTRYADDFYVSSKYGFSFRKIENLIKKTLESFGAPFNINTEKTRYGSRSGANWLLGLMVNKENEITVGHDTKKRFKTAIFNYLKDRENGISWDKEDLMILEGQRSYYTSIEGDVITSMVNHIAKKFNNVNVVELIKNDILAA